MRSSGSYIYLGAKLIFMAMMYTQILYYRVVGTQFTYIYIYTHTHTQCAVYYSGVLIIGRKSYQMNIL